MSYRYEKIKNAFWISFGTSLLIEVLQFVFYLGSCDIDDIILNVLGSRDTVLNQWNEQEYGDEFEYSKESPKGLTYEMLEKSTQ